MLRIVIPAVSESVRRDGGSAGDVPIRVFRPPGHSSEGKTKEFAGDVSSDGAHIVR